MYELFAPISEGLCLIDSHQEHWIGYIYLQAILSSIIFLHRLDWTVTQGYPVLQKLDGFSVLKKIIFCATCFLFYLKGTIIKTWGLWIVALETRSLAENCYTCTRLKLICACWRKLVQILIMRKSFAQPVDLLKKLQNA